MNVLIDSTAVRDVLNSKSPEEIDKDWSLWSQKMWEIFTEILLSHKVRDPNDLPTQFHIIDINKRDKILKLKIDKCIISEGCYIFFDDARENIIFVTWSTTDPQKLYRKLVNFLDPTQKHPKNVTSNVINDLTGEVRIIGQMKK